MLQKHRSRLPARVARPSARLVAMGMKSLYNLTLSGGDWRVNQVTNTVSGYEIGAGVTFDSGGRLKTPGVAGDGAALPHGLALDISAPISIVIGWEFVSGTVSWSLLDNVFQWYGWYGTTTGQVTTSNNNSFDGSLAFTGKNVAFSHSSSTDLRGFGSGFLTDTSAQFPSGVSNDSFILGWSKLGAPDANPAVALFTHAAAFQGKVSDSVLRELAEAPSLLWERPKERSIFLGAAASAGATISVPSGAVSVSGYAPTVTTTAHQTISVPAGAVSLTGYAPTVNTSASQTIAVPAGAVSLTGYAPTVFTTAVTTITVPAGAVSLAGFAPSVSYTTHAYIDVPKGAVGLTGYAPTVLGGESGIWTPVTVDAATWTPQ